MSNQKGNTATFRFNFFDVGFTDFSYLVGCGEQTEEVVLSDKKRIESENGSKAAFVVSTENASMFEDFPCNPLGVYTIHGNW